MSASDWSDKGQIIWSETPFLLSIELQRSAAFTTTLSLTSVSPGTIPVRSLRSFYVKQLCIAYSSMMLLKLYTVHGLAVVVFSARSSARAHGFKGAVTSFEPVLTHHTPMDFFDVMFIILTIPKLSQNIYPQHLI